jgi:hypothetical protein
MKKSLALNISRFLCNLTGSVVNFTEIGSLIL